MTKNKREVPKMKSRLLFVLAAALLLASCFSMPVKVGIDYNSSLPKEETVTVDFVGIIPRVYNGKDVSGTWESYTFIRIPKGYSQFGVDVAADVFTNTGKMNRGSGSITHYQKKGYTFSYNFDKTDDLLLCFEIDKSTKAFGVGIYRYKDQGKRIDFVAFDN
jgi:hypothetical protein